MPKSFVQGRFPIVLAIALTLLAVHPARTVAGSPAGPKRPAPGAGTCEKNRSGLWASLKQFVTEMGELEDFLRLSVACLQPPTDPRRSMLIRVVDPTGRPVAGAIVQPVEIVRYQEDLLGNSQTLSELGWTRSATASDGTVRIARPITKDKGIQVEIAAEGYVLSSAAWNGQEGVYEPIPAEFTFKLDRSQPVGGIVRDSLGRPVAGARVALSLDEEDGGGRVRHNLDAHEERTDLQGRWRCGHLPSRVKGLTITVSHDEHVDLDLDEAEVAAQRPDLRAMKAVFVMKPGLIVQGKVTDEKGKPVSSAWVTLDPKRITLGEPEPTRAEVTAGEDGRYRFGNCSPGENSIVVSARGLVTQQREITIKPGMAPVDFRLAPGRIVKIRVVDPAGKPLAGAEVMPDFTFGFSDGEAYLADTIATDREGRWATASSPQREVALTINRRGYATAHPRLAARDKEYVITLRPPVRISGRVIDAVTKKPIRRIYVSADDIDSGRKSGTTIEPSVKVDGEGRYELVFGDTLGVDEATWQLRVQAPGYVTQLSRKFRTREGSRTLDFALARGRAVCGVVKRPDGSPVAGAKIFVSTASYPWTIEDGRISETPEMSLWFYERSAADGRFELPMPLEPYVVGVVHEFGGAEISAQDLDARGEIVLRPWARVEGVIQPSCHPSHDGKQTVFLDAGPDSNSPSDEHNKRPRIEWSYSADLGPSGRFAFERVLPGRCEVDPVPLSGIYILNGEAISRWRPQGFEAVAGQTTRVEFARKGRAVAGRAVLPAVGSRKIAVAGGFGGLLFRRPLVPAPKAIAGTSADARKRWEKQWLESEAGKAADRAGQNHLFPVAADGAFKAENVAPGIYRLLVELHGPSAKPDEDGDEVGWLAQEITIPAAGSPHKKPLDLGSFTLQRARLFRGDAAPDFAFKTADGRIHRLSEYRGRNVALHFTKTWNELERGPDAAATRQWYLQSGGGEPLVWVNLSSDPTPRPAVKVAQDSKFQYFQGAPEASADVLKAYDVRHPTSAGSLVLVSRDGKVVRK